MAPGAAVLWLLAGASALELREPHGEAGVAGIPSGLPGAPLRLSDAGLASSSLSWEGLSLQEQLQMLQGCHSTGAEPEPGYYSGYTDPIERLGLPALKMQFGGNGFRTTEPGTEGTTTVWPSNLALASTWDEDLVGRVSTAMGREFSGKGANVMLGPAVAVHRVAQGGRNFEFLSGEDPYLGSRLARAFVKGVQSQGVMCAVKNFAFNHQETNRQLSSANVDERTAWELYYPPFEAAIQAGAGAVMCAVNRVNGTFACHNRGLLQRDLRGAMGFQGMVISELGGVHGIDALEVGTDLELPGRTALSPGKFKLESLFQVDPRSVAAATVRVRSAMFSVGLDKAPSCTPPFCSAQLRSQQTSTEHSALARDAALGAVTLLKNKGPLLPLDLDRVRKLAVLGSASFRLGLDGPFRADYVSGGGSGHVAGKMLMATALGAIKQRMRWTSEAQVLSIPGASNLEAMSKLKDVAGADVVVVVAAASSSEAVDRPTLSLDDHADTLIRAVAALGKPTVVLMQTPGAVLTPWRDDPHVLAIANIFLGGEQTGRALAGLLFGDHSPSGKLPIIFPATALDAIPPHREPELHYDEGLFTSYRSGFRAAFPFGFGLSYTRFTISKPKQAAQCSAAACVLVTVANVGSRSGAEVPQAYVEFAPELHEPKIVLRGFQRVFLRAGETREVTFAFTPRDLSVYLPGRGWQQQRIVKVHVGTSSAHLQPAVLVRAHSVSAGAGAGA